jgi:nucleoside-diphosphate-sugar epimerase
VETSVLELVDLLRPLAAGEFEPQHEPERPGEVRHTALDASRAREVLGWSPSAAVEEGLAQTFTWLGSAG